MQRLDFHAMGCQMFAASDTPPGDSTEVLALVLEWFAEWERHLSRFRSDSELAELNRARGKPMVVSETMAQVVRQALIAAHDSAGLVTPAILTALEAAGYDTSFESVHSSHLPVERVSVPDWRTVQLDSASRTLQTPRDIQLDFGGIAKGWAADQAVGRLATFGPALVDAGGDIAVSGPMANGEPWLIGVADPFAPQRDLALLALTRGGVATSGRDFRRWRRNGAMQHHIIDPRTGEPAKSNVLTATVAAPNVLVAETAAKVVLIVGSKEGLEWLEAHGLDGLLVLDDGTILQTPSMQNLLLPCETCDFVNQPYGASYVIAPN